MNPPAKKRLMVSPEEMDKEEAVQLADKVLDWAKALIPKTNVKEIS